MNSIVRTFKASVILIITTLSLVASMLILRMGPAHAAFPGVNGTIAFESHRDGNVEIYVMNADGSGQTNLTNNPATDDDPAFSPDGTRIAFVSLRNGNREIYLMNADGSNPINLTNNPADDIQPAFSPDGLQLAFASNRHGNREIYVLNIDGTNLMRITNNPAIDRAPAFSPDGTRIAFRSDRDGNDEIYLMNADGSNQTNLTNHPAFDFAPVFSPDGLKIAFTSTRDGNDEVYLMNTDGSGQTNITNSKLGDNYPAFSPDGMKIVYRSARDGNREIYVMNVDGTNQTRLTNELAEDLDPDWGASAAPLTGMPPTDVPTATPADPPVGTPTSPPTRTRTDTPPPTQSSVPTATSTALLASTPTNTPTPALSPTYTFTPTASPTVVADLIFADGFEFGNLSAWSSSTTDAGDLSAHAVAAQTGAYGLLATIDDNNAIYVTDDSPNAEKRYRARFYFDPNSIVMQNNDTHYLFYGYSGTSTVVLRAQLRLSNGSYQLRAALRNDASSWASSPWFSISDASHYFELDWRAATTSGANNGSLTLWFDGTQMADLTGIDNDTRRIDRVRLGAVAGIDSGTRGAYYFDQFASNRQIYIGP